MGHRAGLTRRWEQKGRANSAGGGLRMLRVGVALAAGLALVAVAGCAGGARPKSADGVASVGRGQTGSENGEGASRSTTGPASDKASERTTANGRSGVLNGALFGGDVPLAEVEPGLGRPLAIVRDYYQLGARFPYAADAKLMARGSTMLVSLDTVPGGPTYASIAAGRHDAVITAFLASVERAAVRYGLGAIYIAFEHEADTGPHHIGLGTPAQFASAWDHINQLAESMHLDWNQGGRLHWVWILTSGAFRQGIASEYWPGANEVDIVAVDGYNTGGCRHARPGTNLVGLGNSVESPVELFGAAISFARTHGGLPVFIPEWGTIPYESSAVQPWYIQQMQNYVTQNPEIAAALYWDNHGHSNGCDYTIDSHPASLSALAAMGRASALQGQIVSAG